MYFVKTPALIKPLYSDLIWRMPEQPNEKVVYLTFDDGPTPEVTDATFEILDEYAAKATFFLVGSAVENHPEYLRKYLEKGHSIGHHSHTHLNGWKTDNSVYLKDILVASKLIDSQLFRPPYGKIKRSQAKTLRDNFSIVMWDVLSGDFDSKVNVDKCISNVTENVSNGSIVVLHDSLKSAKTMLEALPEILSNLKAKGYSFKPIPENYRLKG